MNDERSATLSDKPNARKRKGVVVISPRICGETSCNQILVFGPTILIRFLRSLSARASFTAQSET